METIGLDDDFFDLGGHSLTAVRMFSKIKKSYQQDLNLSTLFEARTIRQLAGMIRKAETSSIPAHQVDLDPAALVETRDTASPTLPVSRNHRPVPKPRLGPP